MAQSGYHRSNIVQMQHKSRCTAPQHLAWTTIAALSAAIPLPVQASNRPSKIQDVARAAGVSAMTVSRAINHPERLNPETLQRVRDAIASMRCVPNAQPMAWA